MRLVCVICMLCVGLTGCGLTPEQEARNRLYTTILNGTYLSAPGVQEAINEFTSRHDLDPIDVNYLIAQGVSDEVILAVFDGGLDPLLQNYDRVQSYNLHPASNSPYDQANAFQAAISASRAALAEKIAIRVSKAAGDYRPGLPLGAIPSVVSLASDMGEGLRFGNGENTQMNRVNATVKMVEYYDPPGQGLLLRHARAIRTALPRQFLKDNNLRFTDIRSPQTHTEGGNGVHAKRYVNYRREEHAKTIAFISKNFGADLNKKMPFCQLFGEWEYECMPMSATQLAGYTNSLLVSQWSQALNWRNPGKLEAYIAAGGDGNVKDRYGNTAIAYATNGGYYPGDSGKSGGLEIGQLFAGAAVIAGSGYLASQGGNTQAIEFLGAGLTDIANGNTQNLNALNSSSQANTASGANANSGSKQGSSNPAATTSQYTFACPHTPAKSKTIPITTAISACRTAMQVYAKAASCNLVDELESAQTNYYSACATEIYAQ